MTRAAARPAVKPQAPCPASLRTCLAQGSTTASDTSRSDLCAPPHDAFVLFDVLSPGECQSLMSQADALGYSFWHPTPGASETRFRNADTVEVTCPELAAALWARLQRHVTAVVQLEEDTCERGVQGTWAAVGVNPVLLFSRYTPGGHFSPHTDGNTVVDFNTRSLYSVIVYLNTCEDGSGGTTLFVPPTGVGNTPPGDAYSTDEAHRLRWPPEWAVGTAPAQEGAVLVFQQEVPHEGVPLGPGQTKYIIRTDIMYQRTPALCDDASGRAAYMLVQQAAAAEADGHADMAAKLYRAAVRECPSLAHMVGIA